MADGSEDDFGPLLDPELSDELERRDRERPGPGAEPPCPVCGTSMVRMVEAHKAPRSDESPFRVRLVCPQEGCRRWTVYDW